MLRRAAVDIGEPLDPEAAHLDPDRAFTVTDGRQVWRLALIETALAAQPLLMAQGSLPPRGRDLWVVRAPEPSPSRLMRPDPRVICFTAGTTLLTPDGYRPVEDLGAGDRIMTRDDGAQEILWVGETTLSGARLAAAPHLRPVRLRAHAMADGMPDGDLLVSPRHRILVGGQAARDLFNTPEVLVAARDLVNDRTILVDHSSRSVRYVHILMERHQVIFANGIASESFHPADADLDALAPADRIALERAVPGLPANPESYGDLARRTLGPAEAAILLQGARSDALTLSAGRV
ncbi:Hint domain-containing protein [Palleronia pelagia]|uniref:Hint domain-containing protein n=1 Tax=Palleronia pelagia TaxID=387096 RepID=A0A1H8K619_9RHOB|nr:Hint domain-containing protein [Palleronia pelagia]